MVESQQHPTVTWRARFYPLIQWPFRVGTFSFLAGTGLAGSTHFRRMGILSTALALLVLLGWLIWVLVLRSVFGGRRRMA